MQFVIICWINKILIHSAFTPLWNGIYTPKKEKGERRCVVSFLSVLTQSDFFLILSKSIFHIILTHSNQFGYPSITQLIAIFIKSFPPRIPAVNFLVC